MIYMSKKSSDFPSLSILTFDLNLYKIELFDQSFFPIYEFIELFQKKGMGLVQIL